MYDQAADLRELVRRGATPRSAARSPSPGLVVIGGGKGGVGTTTIAVNLAVVLARQGRRTALVDADPHGGDAAMLLGLDERYTLADVLQSRRTVEEAFLPGAAGLWVLPSAWADSGVQEASTAAHERFFAQLGNLGNRIDYVVVDVGNAPDRLCRRFWQVADLIVVATTPDEASVMAAYARIKASALDRNPGSIRTFVNRAGGVAAREVHARLTRACLRFLDVRPLGLGHLADDPSIAAAGRAREPFVTSAPHGESTQRVCRLAETAARLKKAPSAHCRVAC